jgi:hypothetical protein
LNVDARAAALEAHNEGVALARAGDYAGAASRFLRATRIAGADAVDPRTLKALWRASVDVGEWTTAIAAGVQGAVRDPMDFRFSQDVVVSIARCPMSQLVSPDGLRPPALPRDLPALSVIVVSQDDARFQSVDAEFERAFAAWPHQRIRVKGARSMYDGYARGLAQSRGELVVFSHDDIRFSRPDVAARLALAMEGADLVGAVGTTRLSGPAVLWAGHPSMHGVIAHEVDGESDFEFAVASLEGPRVFGAQAVDGAFIAVRREWVERVGFDPERFDGFHFYDVDFSYRAHLAGARVAIAGDLGLIHRSRGAFDERWTAAQRVFAAKFGLPSEPPARDRHFYCVRLPDRASVGEMYAKLSAAWTLKLT